MSGLPQPAVLAQGAHWLGHLPHPTSTWALCLSAAGMCPPVPHTSDAGGRPGEHNWFYLFPHETLHGMGLRPHQERVAMPDPSPAPASWTELQIWLLSLYTSLPRRTVPPSSGPSPHQSLELEGAGQPWGVRGGFKMVSCWALHFPATFPRKCRPSGPAVLVPGPPSGSALPSRRPRPARCALCTVAWPPILQRGLCQQPNCQGRFPP